MNGCNCWVGLILYKFEVTMNNEQETKKQLSTQKYTAILRVEVGMSIAFKLLEHGSHPRTTRKWFNIVWIYAIAPSGRSEGESQMISLCLVEAVVKSLRVLDSAPLDLAPKNPSKKIRISIEVQENSCNQRQPTVLPTNHFWTIHPTSPTRPLPGYSLTKVLV